MHCSPEAWDTLALSDQLNAYSRMNISEKWTSKALLGNNWGVMNVMNVAELFRHTYWV